MNERNMKKHFRILAGIILHPVRVLIARARRTRDERKIRNKVMLNWQHKAWERMHNMSDVTNTAYTKSEIYPKLHTLSL